uniref:Uncharacterized protein n=1 Tax=Siphoviridae sp. ctgN495 TaxID=2825608 RepID=A0A8S5UD11_9CAUD|nr:MAG TPA: hypothetical protein [Siphoviridae sp. ctgN495]
MTAILNSAGSECKIDTLFALYGGNLNGYLYSVEISFKA